MLVQADKDFAREYGKEDIEKAMHVFQKDVTVVVMSKIAAKTFNAKDGLGERAIFGKMEDQQEKAGITQNMQSKIPLKQMHISHDDYAMTKTEFQQLNVVLWALL